MARGWELGVQLKIYDGKLEYVTRRKEQGQQEEHYSGSI